MTDKHEFVVGDVVEDGILKGVIVDFFDADTAVVLCIADEILRTFYIPTKCLAYQDKNIKDIVDNLVREVYDG